MHRVHLDLVYAAVALGCAMIGGVWDVRTRRIPNWLTGPSILLGLILHLALSGWKAATTAALAGLIAGVIFLLFHLAGGMGAGDVKLITAVCTLAGLSRVPEILILTALSGGIFAIAMALYHRRLKETLSNVSVLAAHHGSRGLQPHAELNVENAANIRLPYGIAIATGAALSFVNVLLG